MIKIKLHSFLFAALMLLISVSSCNQNKTETSINDGGLILQKKTNAGKSNQ